jgi:hypothetical protein
VTARPRRNSRKTALTERRYSRRWTYETASNRLVHHQATVIETEHGPTPIILPTFHGESELLIKLHAGRHALHRQHGNETSHFHKVPLAERYQGAFRWQPLRLKKENAQRNDL